MTAFISFVIILSGIIMLLRFLRKREIQAFREGDMSVFEELKITHPSASSNNMAAPSQIAGATSNIIPLPTDYSNAETKPVFIQRKLLFDEVRRSFFENLERVAGKRYRILMQVGLADFVRVDGDQQAQQKIHGKTISFVLCEKQDLRLVCGIQLRASGSEFVREFEFLRELFLQIRKPLIDFPLVNTVSEEEIREKLSEVLNDSAISRNCPKCSKQMLMRKAVKGKNTGKSFWVCSGYPSCSGIIRIGMFS